MTPQLTKIAECLSESHAREIKLARCLAESLKRIQTIEAAVKTDDKKTKPIEARLNAAIQVVADKVTKNNEASLIELQSLKADANTKSKITEIRFQSALRDLAEQLAKQTAETEEVGRRMEEAIKVEFPAQLAALKAEFATPAAQAAAPQSFNPRGDYEAGEKYKPFDYVSSNGSSYIALVENPTQPPSKKSKQWMLVAARGAGGGGVTGLGTAAYRDVGQAAGNVLELSDAGTISLGGEPSADGAIRLYDSVSDVYQIISASDGELSLNGYTLRNVTGNQVYLSNRNVTALREFEFPNASGTIALLSQVGDRYLTSSTTSNTVSNGAKTFTISTGLAYTPTQDISIVFNASNHMHASVTSYNSATGALVVDVNSHTGSGTYAVWTVNVGGIGAGAIPSGGTTGQVLAKVSATDYDDAWVTPTVAVGGVTGLGTSVATALAINVGSAGSPVVNGGALGTPSSGTVTNLSGTASININGTVGATTPASGAFTSGTFTTSLKSNTALATPSALTATEANFYASTVSGASISGFGTTNDVTLRNRAGTVCLGVGPNTTTVNIAGNLLLGTSSILQGGYAGGTIVASLNSSGTEAGGAFLAEQFYVRNSGQSFVALLGNLGKWNSAGVVGFTTGTNAAGTNIATGISRISDGLLAIGTGASGSFAGSLKATNAEFVGTLTVAGNVLLAKTITASGTTGAQTIDKSSGAVNFAAAASSLVVTNSLVTVNSVIVVSKGTNDTTARLGAAVAAAGSFTIYMDVAPAAETRVNFILTN